MAERALSTRPLSYHAQNQNATGRFCPSQPRKADAVRAEQVEPMHPSLRQKRADPLALSWMLVRRDSSLDTKTTRPLFSSRVRDSTRAVPKQQK